MQKLIGQLDHNPDDINFVEIMQKILDSKKIIIVTTLIFSIISTFYTFQKIPVYESSALVEMAIFQEPDGDLQLVETKEDLIRNIKINLIYKESNQKLLKTLRITDIENRFIEIKNTSSSLEKNELLLSDFVNYIVERQTLLINNILSEKPISLKSQISKIQEQIDFEKSLNEIKIQNLKNKISLLNELILEDSANSEFFNDEQKYLFAPPKENHKLSKKDLELELFNEKNSRVIFNLIQQKDDLVTELEILSASIPSYVKPMLVGKIETSEQKSSNLLFILASTIFGIFIAILIVFLRDFVKKLQF